MGHKIIQSLFTCTYLINIMWKFSRNWIMHKLKSISRCQHSCTLHLIWHLPLNFELLAQTASSRNLIAMQKKNNPVPYKSIILHLIKTVFNVFLRIHYYNIDNLRIVKKRGFWNYEIQVKSYEGILKINLFVYKQIDFQKHTFLQFSVS